MVGSVSSSSSRGHGGDRVRKPRAFTRQIQLVRQEQEQKQQQKQKAAMTRQRAVAVTESEARELDSRLDPEDSSSKASMSAPPSPLHMPSAQPGNLNSFLLSTTPVVPAQCFLKMSARSLRNGETVDPYFTLADLWESFKEWSAYGAGVPLVLNGSDSVVQYYVPYLSGIQLYVESSGLQLRSRSPGEDGGMDQCRTQKSGGNRDVEGTWQLTERLKKVSLGDKPKGIPNGSSSDLNEVCSPPGALVFEYLERDPPYGREPLADKIALLACRFPELKSYKSCDLLPASWISVAWYPIYRIPIGQSLRDLDACFLTFHSLSTSSKDTSGYPDVRCCSIKNFHNPGEKSGKISLPIFGLASYKFKGSIWTSDGMSEGQQANSLLQAADSWLRQLQVQHPDFSFFLSHNGTYRRSVCDNPCSIHSAPLLGSKEDQLQDFEGALTVQKIAFCNSQGICDLLSEMMKQKHGLHVDPLTDVVICCGQTEAFAAAIFATINPGDEVLLFDPAYETYETCIAIAGGAPVYFELDPPYWSLDVDKFNKSFTPQTKAVVLNSPHNPTGKVFSREELEAIAEACRRMDCIAITDEVYEYITYGMLKHTSIACLPGMGERTIITSSLSKTFSVTGWRIGWAIAPSTIASAIRNIHVKITDSAPAPFQEAALTALSSPTSYLESLKKDYEARRDYAMEFLIKLGFQVHFKPQGSFFIFAELPENWLSSDVDFVENLIKKAGVAAVPGCGFFHSPRNGQQYQNRYVRFAFCKSIATLSAAADRISKLASD